MGQRSAMNKSLERMRELLQSAHATSVWWQKNKKSAQRFALWRSTLGAAWHFITFVLAMSGYLWLSVSSSGVLVDGVKIAAFSLVVALWVIVCIKASHRFDRYMFQRFEEGCALCGFDYMLEGTVFLSENKFTPQKQEDDVVNNVLRAVNTMELAEVQHLRAQLEQLRTTDLPRSWWYHMQTAVKDVQNSAKTNR